MLAIIYLIIIYQFSNFVDLTSSAAVTGIGIPRTSNTCFNSLAVLSSASELISHKTNVAPWWPSSLAISFPIPFAAPVTKTISPSTSFLQCGIKSRTKGFKKVKDRSKNELKNVFYEPEVMQYPLKALNKLVMHVSGLVGTATNYSSFCVFT